MAGRVLIGANKAGPIIPVSWPTRSGCACDPPKGMLVPAIVHAVGLVRAMTGRQGAGPNFFPRRHLILIRMGLVLAIPHRRRAEALPDARIGRTILLGQPELFILRHDQATW